ncbi:hypothetical protein MY10362_009822 [Beauveria mimosiformis]
MQLSMILASLCGMALAGPAAKIRRSPVEVDELGRNVPQVGELPYGDPALPEGAGGNALGDGLQVPDIVDELAPAVAQEWAGQDLGADIFGDLGEVGAAVVG